MTEVLESSLSPVVFAYGVARKKGISTQPVFQACF